MSFESQSSFQTFASLLRSFYWKIGKNHSDYAKNNNRLNLMLANMNADVQGKNQKKADHHLAFPHSQNSSSGVFCSQSFEHVFTFAYLYDIIEGEDYDIINLIQQNVKIQAKTNCYANSKDKTQWDRSMIEWAKIRLSANYQDKDKSERIFAAAFEKLSAKFIKPITKSILSLNNATLSDISFSSEWLSQASKSLKRSFLIIQLPKNQTKLFGDYDRLLRFGVDNKNKQHVTYYFYRNVSNSRATISASPKKKLLEELQKNEFRERKQLSIKQKISLIKKQQNSEKSLKSLTEVKSAHNKKLQRIDSTVPSQTKSFSHGRLAAKKALITVEFLLKQLHLNTGKLENLECFDCEQQLKRSPKTERKLVSYKSLRHV